MLLGSITCFAQESGAGWWHDLGDSVLDSLVDVGVRNNYDVAMAARRIGIARAGVGTARAGYFPTIGVSASYAKYNPQNEMFRLPETKCSAT